MHWMLSKSAWLPRSLALGIVTAILAISGCESDPSRAGYAPSGVDIGDPRGVDYCATPKQGCECPTEGRSVACGSTAEKFDDYVTCSQGQRTCSGGRWGACITDRIVQRPLPVAEDEATALRGSSLAALGNAGACPAGFDVCDPDCQRLVDGAGGFDAGAKFTNTTELKPIKSPPANCGTLAITPSATVATVTQISPIVAPTITLSAVLTPPCAASPFTTTWTIDRFDIGSITGTNGSNGVFTVANPVVGNVTVTAYAVGLSATTTIQVKVNAVQSSGVSPNNAATATQIGKFLLSPSASQSVTWLYPYAGTYFPLGLLAPVVQYRGGTGAGGTVKASLRYPSGTTAAASTFNYSIIATESNVVSVSGAGRPVDVSKPQVVFPQVAWQAFEQTARGSNADLVIQRLRSDGTTLEAENARQIYVVDGQLKGTVYYNSYSSQLSTYNTGAVLKISPGASAPTLAVQPSGKCTVCHSVNADGTKLISGGGTGGVGTYNKSRRYDMTTTSLYPAPTVLNTYDVASTDTENVQGDKFNFGGVWTDGSLYMTHGGNSSTSGSPAPYGDRNWRSPPDFSRLYNPASPASAITVTGWTNISAVTPRFSPDGTKLAFGFWGGNGVTLAQSPTGTLTADTTGKTLAVVDFKCATSACTGASTGWNVSNARNLTPGVTHKVGWPAFTPAGDAVLYQRQYRSAKNYLSWSPTDMNTVGGALAEIWISPVPANKNTAAVPTELRQLNGLDPSPATTSYLPTTTATTYHVANGAFTINQADACSVTAAVSGVNDYQLNYLPAMAPTSAGGYNWVVFTSRRMYGNIADDDPWDAEPGPTACGGAPCSCSSGVPPTKKLWVAAINTTVTGGQDPSHPAFYLPGQELKAGNSDGYWVNSACVAVGAACSSNDDCCGGTGASPSTRCDAATDKCQTISACKGLAVACTTTADCCTGLICAGTGKCANPEFFTSATYQREYKAVCPSGTQVAWRFFEWQSTVPSGTSIDLSVQTKRKATDAYLPTTAVTLGTISSTTSAGVWARGTSTVNQVLTGASLVSMDYLLVSMKFKPNTQGDLAPSLSNWRQNYDCVDSE
jgi:hypothetical protein